MAKGQLGEKDFSEVLKLLPDIEEVLATTPETGRLGSACQEIDSVEGNGMRKERVKSLVGGFMHLGLGCSMIDKFIPFILAYIRCKGGDEVNSLREKDLR